MVKAGANEKKIEKELKRLGIKLDGKCNSKEIEGIKTSVDQVISFENRKILLEIDSYNMAKVAVGQYLLINGMLKEEFNKNDTVFVVIQCYKKFNPKRTENHLAYMNNHMLKEKGLPYKSYTKEEFISICSEVRSNEKLIDRLFNESIKP